ncbi:MAG TPA: VTT domain-containing protein [Dehalococcoidia bacterium]|nr:VTT domain-containing protein [Dehalococcoidia bacterium]
MAGPAHALGLLLTRYGILALFVLLTMEEVGVWLPLPGDLLIVYFGYRAVHAPQPLLSAIPVLLTVVAAAMCGSTLLFMLVRRYRRMLRRLGPLIHLDETRLRRMEAWLRRRGAPAVVLVRLVPGLRIPTTIVSATFGLRLTVFVRAIAVSALLWGALYFAVGAAGATAIDTAERLVRAEISRWLLPLLVAAAVAATIVRFRHSRATSGRKS